MNTKLIILVLLFVCFSCGTNNKAVSDAQKEKIKGDIKEVVNTFIKGIEEANADKVMESFLDSPDFVDITNGMAFSYKEIMAMKPNFNAILNQRCKMVNEKCTFLDKSTVLYIAETKWSTNYKDGHSSITDPQAFLFVFKKIDNRWKVIHLVDSYVEKNVPSESPKGLNQVELMKKFLGSWKCNVDKDTICYWDIESFGTGIVGYFKYVTKGEIVKEGKELWGYDKTIDKCILSEMIKGMDTELYVTWFISKNRCNMYPYGNNPNPEKASSKWKVEFTSPNVLVETTFLNSNPVKIDTYTRVK
jgi:hypothetical protein